MPGGLADKPPMSSVPERRQTPGGLHPQRSKVQGDTIPSEALLLQPAANMAEGFSPFAGLQAVHRPHAWRSGRQTAYEPSS